MLWLYYGYGYLCLKFSCWLRDDPDSLSLVFQFIRRLQLWHADVQDFIINCNTSSNEYRYDDFGRIDTSCVIWTSAKKKEDVLIYYKLELTKSERWVISVTDDSTHTPSFNMSIALSASSATVNVSSGDFEFEGWCLSKTFSIPGKDTLFKKVLFLSLARCLMTPRYIEMSTCVKWQFWIWRGVWNFNLLFI